MQLRNKLNEIGVLTEGKYDNVISYIIVNGYWGPLEGSTPFDGEVGEISFGTECKMEFRCSYRDIELVKKIIKDVHPYEVPIINILPLLY